MKKEIKKYYVLPTLFLTVFLLWTIAVSTLDVRAIGPEGSRVGFAALNRLIHSLTGVNMLLYTLTDWLSLVPVGLVAGFALLGLFQWIKRKSIFQVDHSILILGGFYVITLTHFVLFEFFPVNYRPILVDGRLEASYPSSTTLLVMCVIPTAMMQLKARIQSTVLRRWVLAVLAVYMAFMVTARLISGVHWFTDIVGGALLSTALVLLYRALIKET